MAKVTRAGEPLKNVSITIKKAAEHVTEWVFVALDGSTPRLVIPRRFYGTESIETSGNTVSINFLYEFNRKKIVVELDNSAEAEKFSQFLLLPYEE